MGHAFPGRSAGLSGSPQHPCKATLKKIYSRDANAWHISTEGGELESTWNEPSEAVWQWDRLRRAGTERAGIRQLTVAKGEVVAVDDQP